MRKAIILFLFIISIELVLIYKDDLLNYAIDNYIIKREVKMQPINNYKSNVLTFDDDELKEGYIPSSKEDLINIIYKVVNNGWNDYTIYCEKDYITCIDDLKDIVKDEELIDSIRNLLHPFNGYSGLNIKYNNYGEIIIHADKMYTQEDIDQINSKIDTIYPTIVNANMSNYEKIKAVHDYIATHTIYDKQKADFTTKVSDIDSQYKSDTAYGPLFQGHAICSGYTDLMSIFLYKMGFKNYKLTSDQHTWNYVYLNDEWLHIDVTFDDPITLDNTQMTLHEMFLINDTQMNNLNEKDHIFRNNVLLKK